MLTSLRSLIARAMLRLAIATAPDAAALRLQEALGPTWQALQAEAWNMGSALGRLVLLALVALAYRSWAVTTAALWWCFEDAQVVGCAGARTGRGVTC